MRACTAPSPWRSEWAGRKVLGGPAPENVKLRPSGCWDCWKRRKIDMEKIRVGVVGATGYAGSEICG